MQFRRLGAPGLRGRIVGALLITTVATLAVAALALLGPLERQLRHAELNTLVKEVNHDLPSFRRMTPAEIASGETTSGKPGAGQRISAANALASRTGGEVNLIAFPRVLLATSDLTSAAADNFSDATKAFQTGHTVLSFGSSDGNEVARVAILIGSPTSSNAYVLAVRKPIPEVAGAVHVVRTAFITAAVAGLALTLFLGIAIAPTLVRRLRRLRQAALRLASGGPPVELPVDRARDEVGDLTRTFTTMQRRLQHQEEARRAFVATASHELRTPLASLDGMLELLDDDLRGGEPDLDDARELLERARAQSRRLGRLAADLLDLSRIDAEVALRSEPVELGELSRAVLAEFELGTTERQITSVLDEDAGPVWALGDPGSVARIVRILLDNAVRASPDGAEIRVQLRAGETAELSVRDSGPGVPADERELIFERFQRGTSRGSKAGFGLGLAIGRELAERMGGGLVLEDDGRPGAKFTLRLQMAKAPEQRKLPVG